MKHFQSPKFWKGIKKKRKLRNILLSIFIIPTIFLGSIAFVGKAPEVYILSIICLIAGLVIFLPFYFLEIKTKQIINSLSPSEANLISLEMESEKAKYYEKDNLFLTENHIISFKNKLVILKYNDIIWIYNIGISYGAQGGLKLQVYTKNHKIHSIFSSPFGKTQEINLEIMNFIFKKNPNVLRGYTNENIKIINEKKQEYKKSL